MARSTFNETASERSNTRDAGTPLPHRCSARLCPIPGAVEGFCGYHYREPSGDWPKITQTLVDWECVVRVINRARSVVTNPATCTDGKAQAAALADEWAHLLPAVQGSGWHRRVEPKAGETLGDWGRRLEVFLGARIKSALTGGREVDETKPTPFVEAARKELRDKPLGDVGNAGDWL